MTTIIYRESEFAACDGKWSSGGPPRRDVLEKKAIHIKYQEREAIAFMCGDYPMIALMQALQLKVITGDQYVSLYSLYMRVDHFIFGMVILEKSTGQILSGGGASPMVQIRRKSVAHDLDSSGGGFAVECIYYTERRLRKKMRRHKGFSASSVRCKVSSAVRYAYRRDPFSGGKVYKVIWGHDGIEFNNIPLVNELAKNRYRLILQETLKRIHHRYLEIMTMRQNAQLNPAASLSKAGQPQKKTDSQTPKANGDNGQQMTMSRAINYARLFSD